MTTQELNTISARHALIDGEWQAATIQIKDGRIESIAPHFDETADFVVKDTESLLPGFVDTHVHVNEPGRTDWEGFDSATKAAAVGGVTTIVDMPLNSVPVTTTPPALAVKTSVAREQVNVDTGFWGGAVPENLGHLADLWERGVFGFKCFTAPSGIVEFGYLTPEQVAAACDEIAQLQSLLIVHAEDPAHLQDAATLGQHYDDFLASRPDAAETSAVAMVIDEARRSGARVHILHVSSAEVLPLIRQAKADGVAITAETCPHYLALDAEHIPDGATQYKCCPPIRSQRNQDLLWEALEDGTIDIIVSDHSPSTRELKFAGDGDWAKAWGGIASVQLGLAVIGDAARRRGIGLERVVQWMSTGPAQLVGLDRQGKGAIKQGMAADFTVYDPAAPHPIHATELLHKNKVTAYDGHEVQGAATTTILAGRVIAQDGALVGEPYAGELLFRE